MRYLKTIKIILIITILFICIGQLTVDQHRAEGVTITGGTGENQPPHNPPADTYPGEELGGVTGETDSGGQTPLNLNDGPYGLQGETTGLLAWDFSLLLVSFVILTASFFFLFHVKAMVEWSFRDEEGAPDSYAGLFMSSVVSALIIIIWVFRTMVVMNEPFENFIFEMFYNPREFTPGILIAAILPATVGLLKFITTVAVYQKKATDSGGYQRSYFVVLGYVAFNLITVVASIVTLVQVVK